MSIKIFPRASRWLLAGCIAATIYLSQTSRADSAAGLNELTAKEQRDGWKLLFDGKTESGWKAFKSDKPPGNWNVVDGCLHSLHEGKAGGDLISIETYEDFDLQWEWKLGPKCNSGLKYFVSEKGEHPIGHEYQMIDDENYGKPGSKPLLGTTKGTGSFYDVLPPQKTLKAHPPGEFNHSRVVVHGTKVEHWLNGKKVLTYKIGSKEVNEAIAKSKFKANEGFGDKIKGHILLQDHGDEVWFRNIKLRVFPSK